MKEIDEKILGFMRNNARTNLTTISRKTGIPVSTIFDRLRAHEKTYIQRFTALLDFPALGYPIRAKIFLRAAPQHRAPVGAYLQAHENVNNLWRINNGFDFAVDSIFRTIKEAEEFVDEIELQFTIIKKHVFHIIDTIAQEKILGKIEN